MSKASSKVTTENGVTTVHVSRDYPGGTPPIAPCVWGIVSDFGGLKTIFPNLVRVYLTYPDAKETRVGTLRDMTFLNPNSEYPLSGGNEQLVKRDEDARGIRYISLQGLPVTDYESVMQVTGEDACTLNWTSTIASRVVQRRVAAQTVWAALKSLGRVGLARPVERCCAHARRMVEGLEAAGFEVLNEVALNQVLVSFGTAAQTREVVARVQGDGTYWCGGSRWQGRTAMRISVSSWATTRRISTSASPPSPGSPEKSAPAARWRNRYRRPTRCAPGHPRPRTGERRRHRTSPLRGRR